MPDTVSCCENSRRFGDLRGVQWRIDLGILPSSPSASIDELRQVTANFRRRYAVLRRQLLVDLQISKDGSNSPDSVIDNPLSQNPDSTWGRFFRNAELERMVDQDLTRLYPDRGSYFQTRRCQGMLRRILLLWCIRNQEYGYRQGMHELLAPLLYVLNVDVEQLSEVRKVYEDIFTENFDGFAFHENDLTYKFDFKKFSGKEKRSLMASSLDELDSKTKTFALLTDAYGAEGELGILVSEKFIEHDAYSMFDALMNGAGGALAMADFFSTPFGSTKSVLPPVIAASSGIYHLLSMVDLHLHSHLVELGVEPQFFALRWLRVLFGREFSLEDLLVVWDEIFSCENIKFEKPVENENEDEDEDELNFRVLGSARGAFISAIAVSMILYLRSSLLSSENATTCLQRLLNFPTNVNLVKLIEKAKSLQILAVEANNSAPTPFHLELLDEGKLGISRAHSLSLDSTSPSTPLNIVPESYWEEKWRDFHKEEENKQQDIVKHAPNRRKGWSEKILRRLSRTESDPPPSKLDGRRKAPKPSVRRNLLEDLARQLGLDEDEDEDKDKDADIVRCDENEDKNKAADIVRCNEDEDKDKDSDIVRCDEDEDEDKDKAADIIRCNEDEDEDNDKAADIIWCNEDEDKDSDIVRCDEEDFTPKSETSESEENSFNFSDSPSPVNRVDDPENESARSSIGSNLSIDENDAESNNTASNSPEVIAPKFAQNDDFGRKSVGDVKERKLISGKLQWLWKFGRNKTGETSEVAVVSEEEKPMEGQSGQNNATEGIDRNLKINFRNLGQSMLENIQVIESVFQQDPCQVGPSENLSRNSLIGKGQVTALAALKELRKISNLLSEM